MNNPFIVATIMWLLTVMAVCWAIFVTDNGWWLLILCFINFRVEGDSKNKKEGNQ